MKYPGYAKYKDSRVEWMDVVPEHWEVKRLRFACRTNPVKSELKKLKGDDSVSFVAMEAVGENGGMALEIEKKLDDVYNGYTYFAENDIVIAKITPCFENGKGAIAELRTAGKGTHLSAPTFGRQSALAGYQPGRLGYPLEAAGA